VGTASRAIAWRRESSRARVLVVFSKPATDRVRESHQNRVILIWRNMKRVRGGCIDAKQSLQRIVTVRWMDIYLSNFAPAGFLVTRVVKGVF